MLNNLLRIYGSKTGKRNKVISSLIGIDYTRLVRLQYNQHKDYPDLKELKQIEEFFKVDLKEYYPTECPKIQEFIMKRLDNGINKTDISKLLGYPIAHKHMNNIEYKTFEQLTNNQRIIYYDFMNLVINSTNKNENTTINPRQD